MRSISKNAFLRPALEPKVRGRYINVGRQMRSNIRGEKINAGFKT